MRLGLANMPLMLALDILPFKKFAVLALIKVLGQAIITGTLFSYVFLLSLSGTAASALVMFLLRRSLGPKEPLGNKALMSFTGIGILGALASNSVQAALAWIFVFGQGIRFLIPPLLASGILAGGALGLFCEAFTRRSRWYRLTLENRRGRGAVKAPGPADPPQTPARECPESPGKKRGQERRTKRREIAAELLSSRDLAIAGFLAGLCFLFNPSLTGRALQFVLFWFTAWLSGRKNNAVLTLLVFLGVILSGLAVPSGKVLAQAGIFRLTQGALLQGLRRALTLEGLIMLSRSSVRPDLRLPGPLGGLLAESFCVLERMTREKRSIRRKHIIGDLDNLLLELGAASSPPHHRERSKPPGLAILAAALFITAALCFLPEVIT
jgi:heptaprenyl diphosphate synthase